MHILLVEDNQDSANVLGLFLRTLGHSVQVRYDGLDGVEAACSLRPEVVLCDIGLPRLSGYQIAQALRNNPGTAGAQLIAVTGYGGEEAFWRSHDAGFDLHLVKPVNPEVWEWLLSPKAWWSSTHSDIGGRDEEQWS